MKVYTVTYLNKNYGSILQAYALQIVLKRIGANPIILQERDVSSRISAKQRIKAVLTPRKNYSAYTRAKLFLQKKKFTKKNLKLSKFISENLNVIYTSRDLVSKQVRPDDILLAGSDQIWSMLNSPLSSWYTFQWEKLPEYARKFSYAASIGLSELSEEQRLQYKECLKGFKEVSLREQQAVNLLQNYIDAPVRCDFDPTLLLDAEFWKGVASPCQENRPYIFVYMLRPDRKVIEMAQKIGEKTGKKVIYTGLLADTFKGIETVCDAGIEDFLSLICNADAVITNSFHGTVFSLLFNRPFVSVKLETTSSRVENLLNRVGLLDRLISNEDALTLDKNIDFTYSNRAIEEGRRESLEYLQNICGEKIDDINKFMMPTWFDTNNREDCRGCTACINVCPVGAIAMKKVKGFAYPYIDEEKCIHCNRCRKICNYSTEDAFSEKPGEYYYGWNNDSNIRFNSTSGGAFPAIVSSFLDIYPDAIVYGAIFDKCLQVVHKGSKGKTDLAKMCRSKYIQSNLEGIFEEIKEHIDAGQHVLFSGTPCQVAGLKSFIGDSHNLITMDFICHGVMSPVVFKHYIEKLSKIGGNQIVEYSVRNKLSGSIRMVKTVYSDGKEQVKEDDEMIIAYKNRLYYRESCYSCPFAKEDRYSDFTVGDFWGIENTEPLLNSERKKGISMVTFNTSQALDYKKQVQKYMTLVKADTKTFDYRKMYYPTSRPAVGMDYSLLEGEACEQVLDTLVTNFDKFLYKHKKFARYYHFVNCLIKR